MRGEFHPVAVCTVCGWPLSRQRLALINARCNRRAEDYRCDGIYALAMNPKGWKRCVLCSAAGSINGRPCDLCHGTGWQYRAGLPSQVIFPKKSSIS
jgi:hypothetical protein